FWNISLLCLKNSGGQYFKYSSVSFADVDPCMVKRWMNNSKCDKCDVLEEQLHTLRVKLQSCEALIKELAGYITLSSLEGSPQSVKAKPESSVTDQIYAKFCRLIPGGILCTDQ